jgi:acetylornithine deacetylase/succinyl-diaminopimelate desuccinylase-like protein
VRLAARLSRLDAPRTPRSSYNIGVIEGGSSVNTIAERAALLLDLRSTEPPGLQALVRQVERDIAEARATESGVTFTLETVGDRPAGAIPREHPLPQAAAAAYRAESFTPTFEIASTDANVPLSRGIPAVCVGVCEGANEHRLDEYIEPAWLPAGMRALLWLTLAAGAGVGA